MKTESNWKYIKNLSNLELTNDQINLLVSWIWICLYAYNKRNRIKKTTPYRLCQENAAPVSVSRQGQKHPPLPR